MNQRKSNNEDKPSVRFELECFQHQLKKYLSSKQLSDINDGNYSHFRIASVSCTLHPTRYTVSDGKATILDFAASTIPSTVGGNSWTRTLFLLTLPSGIVFSSSVGGKMYGAFLGLWVLRTANRCRLVEDMLWIFRFSLFLNKFLSMLPWDVVSFDMFAAFSSKRLTYAYVRRRRRIIWVLIPPVLQAMPNWRK